MPCGRLWGNAECRVEEVYFHAGEQKVINECFVLSIILSIQSLLHHLALLKEVISLVL